MDTSKLSSVSGNDLLPLLILHSDRRDRALNLPHPGARTMNLIDYHQRRQREVTTRLAMAAFLKGVIDECRAEVDRLITGADTPEKRRATLPDVERLNILAGKAATELEGMTDG